MTGKKNVRRYTLHEYHYNWPQGGYVELTMDTQGRMLPDTDSPMVFASRGEAELWAINNAHKYHKPEWFVKGPRGGHWPIKYEVL